jgi:FtsH-binding integral membrane protein
VTRLMPLTPFTGRSLFRRPFNAWETKMLFALFLIVTSSMGMTTTLVGNFKDRTACEDAANTTTTVIGSNATIGFVTVCIAAPAP